ncbi:MAG TPA: hypothetical protein VH853_08355 [Polyangia bacterium]|jgi:hypothetical protein|nr:hypothetical protein [Polyangia bacterium]
MSKRTILFGVWLALLARPAWALCPNCLGQSSTLGAALRLIGLFLLVPPAIFFAVAISIRKLARQGAASDPASGSGGGDQRG